MARVPWASSTGHFQEDNGWVESCLPVGHRKWHPVPTLTPPGAVGAGRSLPGLGVGEGQGPSACGQLQDVPPWGRLWGHLFGVRGHSGGGKTPSGSLAFLAQVRDLQVGAAPPPQAGKEACRSCPRPRRARAWPGRGWGCASPGSQGKQPPPRPLPAPAAGGRTGTRAEAR